MSNVLGSPKALFGFLDTASPFGSGGSHPGHGTKCSRRRYKPVNKKLLVGCPDRDANPGRSIPTQAS